jgi:hypothetical protein
MLARSNARLPSLGRQCAIAAMAAALAVPAATAGPKGTDRPSSGQCDTVVRPQPSGILEIDLSCHFRHLGKTTGLLVQEVIPTGPPVNGVLPAALSATVAYTAANGDEPSGTSEGTATIDPVTGNVEYQGTETYSGGTGRFALASGQSFLQGTASTVTNTGFYVTSGRVSY